MVTIIKNWEENKKCFSNSDDGTKSVLKAQFKTTYRQERQKAGGTWCTWRIACFTNHWVGFKTKHF